MSNIVQYRNSADSKNTKYVKLNSSTAGRLVRDNNVLNGTTSANQPVPVEEYAGSIDVTTQAFGDSTFSGVNPDEIPYVDPTIQWLTAMKLDSNIGFKKAMDKWPTGKPVRVDVEFNMATSTQIDVKLDSEFTVDFGAILADFTTLLAATAYNGLWSKRVVMSLAGILKPVVRGNTIRVSCKATHVNRPDDGYDSLTYTVTISIKSALVTWYYNPRDRLVEKLECVYQATSTRDERPKWQFFKVLRALTRRRPLKN